MTTVPLIKTPISYYGGKQAIIQHILPLIPEHDVYTETFFGGGTVFFAKDPAKNETINDRLDLVINFYRVLKTNFKALKKLIDLSLLSRTQHNHATDVCLGKMPADEITRAWAFWYSSNFSFFCKIGGGIKFANDSNTIMPVSFMNKKRDFLDILVTRIENTHIENVDALRVLKSRNTFEAFHYLDTPYFNADMGHYRGYTAQNLKELLTWCANDCKGKFLLSNYNSEVLQEFTQANGWNKTEITHRLKAPRKTGSEKVEVLIWNYNLPVKRDLFTDLK